MLQVKARCYSFEAANVRHEHEWKVWQDVKLPDGKMILPGVVEPFRPIWSSTLSSWPSGSCGSRAASAARTSSPAPTAGSAAGCIREIAWAKLGALVEGARLASKELWK